jgi:gamma-glutamyltranspeptidase/glutathione hydrolase
MLEDELGAAVIAGLEKLGHERALPPAGVRHRVYMGGGQAILIDPLTGALLGASDARKDGFALGY